MVIGVGPTAFGDKDLGRSPILGIANTFCCVSLSNDDGSGVLASAICCQPSAQLNSSPKGTRSFFHVTDKAAECNSFLLLP